MTNTLGLNNVNGGVIGNFTPITTTVDLAKKPELGAVGSHDLGITIPAGKFIVGAFIKNKENDLVGDGASVALVCGNADFIDATEVAGIKGSGIGGCFEGHYIEADTEVELEVSTADLTAGTLEIGILYM